MQTIHWGIIGCGDVTEIKSGPGFQKASGSALVAVMRRDGNKAADYAKRHGVPKWYDDAAKLIADPDLNAIYVATPPSMHETYALMACKAGKPCYVEKPMARNAAEAKRMTEAFAAAKVPLFVAYYRRAMPRFVKAREIIQGGMLGKIKAASYACRDAQMAKRTEPVPWRLQAEQAGGGLFFDLGSHALDLMDYFLGALTFVKASSRNKGKQFDVEDQVELTFSAPGGVAGRADFDFISDTKEDLFRFEGEKATLRFSCFGAEPLVVEAPGKKEQQFEFPRPDHVQQPLIQAIVNDLRGDTAARSWLSTGAVGVRTAELMDRAVMEFYGTRNDGFWRAKANG
jgi:predicted dehydrogenase